MYASLTGLMWKLAALAISVLLPLCAADPALADPTAAKAAPNVTVTEARPRNPTAVAHTNTAHVSATHLFARVRPQTKIDSPVADIQWVGKEKKARAPRERFPRH